MAVISVEYIFGSICKQTPDVAVCVWQEVFVKTRLRHFRVYVIVRTDTKLEVATMVCRDLHRYCDRLKKIIIMKNAKAMAFVSASCKT